MIACIRPFYKGRIVIAEEPAWGNAADGFALYGYSELAEKFPPSNSWISMPTRLWS
ncbi:MAG: hypothetical protein JW929_04570 [Anaerolineales bacterium]|nr:hypothetical protein [Anaerolineales bacterium]